MIDEIVNDFENRSRKVSFLDMANNSTSRVVHKTSLRKKTAVYCVKGKRTIHEGSYESYPHFGRHYTNKWFVWLDQLNPRYNIPDYCNGNCNAMTSEAALKIWEQAKMTDRKGFRIEDMYFLGLIRQKAEERTGEKIPVYETSEVLGYNETRCLHLGGGVIDLSGYKSKTSFYDKLAEQYLAGNFGIRRKGFLTQNWWLDPQN